ncbi:MAG TPA: ATP-binding protein [Puia sp.]|nr:ATP-binding protein [Puia sp.]
MFVISILLVTGMAAFIAWILFIYQKKQNAFQAQLETIRDNNEKEMLRTQLEMQEQTFQYISQEIHDNVGQFISLAKLHLNTINLDDKKSSAEQIEHSTEMLGKALDDLRDLSKSLSSEMIKNTGLVRAIELQVSQLKKAGIHQVSFDMEGTYSYMDEQKEIILFRIMQEAVNNTIRHARADSIKVSLLCTPEYLALKISDNGRGFNLNKLTGNGNGISNMKKRAKLIEGTLDIESGESGTVVTIKISYIKKP